MTVTNNIQTTPKTVRATLTALTAVLVHQPILLGIVTAQPHPLRIWIVSKTLKIFPKTAETVVLTRRTDVP